MGRRHRRSKVTRVVNLVKRIIAFFFSHVGLCALVIGYALLGAVVFRAVEGPHETFIQSEVTMARHLAVNIAWNATFRVNKLDREQWERAVFSQTKIFQKKCMWAIRKGYDGKEFGVSAQWTFTGAFLYSLTVITTIGYGNTAAKTYFGKTLTILFAIIGIPLMLLFLTNIGDVMAKIFRFLYARSIRLKYKLILWHKKRRAAKIRRANSLVAKLTRSSNNRSYFGAGRGLYDDYSLESLGGGMLPTGATTASDVHELLAYNTTRQLEARAQLDQLEVKESVEAQLQRISVPLSLVLLTMLAYLVAGSILFCIWEGWTFLDSFYFCYISLTTIGFGDKFPGASVTGNDKEAQEKLVITRFVKMPTGMIESQMVLKAKCGSEIKKLQLYKGQNWDFDELANKLQRVFKISNHHIVGFKYRDTEGDWITLADDEDLGVAMRNEPFLYVDVLVDFKAEPLSPTVSTTKNSLKEVDKQEPAPLTEQRQKSFSPLVNYRQSVSSTFETKNVPQEPQQLHYNGTPSIQSQQQFMAPFATYPNQQLQPSYHSSQAPLTTPISYQSSQAPPPASNVYQQQPPKNQLPLQNVYQQQPFGMQPLQQELPASVSGNHSSENPFSRGQNVGFTRPNNLRY